MTAAARIATLGGFGRIVPAAPGTAASLLALLVAWGLASIHGQLPVVIVATITTAIGLWSAELYARERGAYDPSECVIDEVAGQLIACAFAPKTLFTYVIAFLLFRLFDIVKPWPIRAAERLAGGLGIMADDVLAGTLGGIIISALVQLRLLSS